MEDPDESSALEALSSGRKALIEGWKAAAERFHLNGETPDEQAISKAMKILLETLPAMFRDLCPSCYTVLSARLTGMASGLELAEIIKNRFEAYSVSGDCTHKVDEGEVGEETQSMSREENGEACFETISFNAVKHIGRSLTPQQRERIRFSQVGRKKDFEDIETVKGRAVNILKGLELHTNVFSAAEQSRLVDLVYELEKKGQRNELKERTYSAPRKWMGGKGRVTLQFGCCYNYATDKDGNPPGILRDEEVDPLPPLLKSTIKRLVRWDVLPSDCVPDSCIINIYEPGDCIPPHIDHHDFLRPFCTLSLLSECSILFGAELSVIGPGEFEGSMSIPLPVGSVLVLNGNGADLAKHCVPAVPTKRISITFRKIHPRKLPYRFKSDPSMQSIAVLET